MNILLNLFKKYNEIIRYIIIGFLTTLVSLLSYYFLITTILNPYNSIQLQIANVISWVLAVSFAFVTNKKIVFRSKRKSFTSEAIKFFASRITTLLIDMFFMFLTVTILHFNPASAKLFVQFIILILNYLLSKYFVFDDSDLFSKRIVFYWYRNKETICVALFVFLLSFLFPYSGDDWTWRLENLSIDKIIEFSKNINLNGRYFGNIIVIFLTKSKLLRGIIISIIISSIFKIINNKFKIHYIYIIILFLLIPLDILRQSIVWTSGFANYGLSTLVLLIILCGYQKLWNNNKFKVNYAILMFLISFLGSLIIENMTIFMILFALFINVISIIKYKKINVNYVISFFGTLSGSIIMFTHPVYLNVFNGKDTYRTMTTTSESFFYRIFDNYVNVIKVFALDKVILLFILMLLIMFAYFFKNKKKITNNNLITGLFIYEYVYVLYIVIKRFNPNWQIFLKYTSFFEILMSLLFILLFVILVLMIYKKKDYNLYFIIACIFGLLAPLFVVTPIGARNFFMIYTLEIILLFELYKVSNLILNLEYFEKIVKIATITLLLYYVNVYSYITLVNYRRYEYIKQSISKGQTNIVVPELPYNEYVWCPDFNDYRAEDIKNLLKIPHEVTFVFTDYDDWKSNYYNNKEEKDD